MSSRSTALRNRNAWRLRVGFGRFGSPVMVQDYRTIEIGGRTWIAQNMNYNVRRGNPGVMMTKNPTAPAAEDSIRPEGAREACPKGFPHPPRDREWHDMLTELTHCYDGAELRRCREARKAKTGWQGSGGMG